MDFFQLFRFSMDTYYTLLLVLSCTVQSFRAFNLDVRFPVVKTGKTPGSLFGFSVALHQQTMGEKRFLLLVGAPKEKAEVGVKANRTGGVYACPLNTDQSDCIRMNLVGSDTDLNEKQDRVEDMWLGVNVASQRQPGGRILTCGHRFVKTPGTTKPYLMIGKCYIRSNDMRYDQNDGQWQNSYEVCQTKETVTEGDQESMCGMGISALITDTEVVVGSPGSYTWQGSVNVIWRSPISSYEIRKSSLPDLKDLNIYIGYSVAKSQRLLSPDKDTVVTGAPRDNMYDSKGSVYMAANDVKGNPLQLQFTLRGEQTGSYFGNSLAVADLNNDGWNDLVVGAPFYFDHKKEHGGAVYVYMNENGSFRKEPDVTLRGPRDSAFGMAVASIGDVNQDGFQDLAVGAPFQGTGTVFIWTGSAQGISQQPSQVIEGKDIAEAGFKTFGYSISGGLDVDDNRYPDMVVGSLDDRVALLRARPVIHLTKSLEVTPEIVDPKDCDYCVTVEVCFSYTISTGDTNFQKNIIVNYTVQADMTRHKARVHFQGNGLDSYTGFLSMPSEKCKTLMLGVANNIQDKVEPVLFTLDVSLKTTDPQNKITLQNLDAFPVLSEGKASTIKKEIHFQKACGLDNKCQSNLQMRAEFANEILEPFPSHAGHQVLQYSTSVTKILLVVDVTNVPSAGQLAEDAHGVVLNITVPPSLIYASVRSKSNNPVIKCSEKNRVLLCDLGNPFASNQIEQVLISFETFEVSLDTKEIQSTLLLSTLSEQQDLQPLALLMVVEYTLSTEFSLLSPTEQTYFSGQVVGDFSMKKPSDVGSPVEFTYKVLVLGKPLGSLGNLEVEFDWPLEVANGKWLLYLTEIQTLGTSDSHCVPPKNIGNPLNLTLPGGKARSKRSEEASTEEVQPRGVAMASLNLKGHPKAEYRLNCFNGAARCVKFTCPLRNIFNTTTIIVRARVWNSTMLEDYSKAGRIIVQTLATLKLVTNNPTIKMANKTAEFTLNIYPELGEEALYQVPLWIIIVAVIAGVLLLGFIIALLWKCGFFKRASTREMYEARALKAEMKTQPSEVERLTDAN